ncbi:MAG: hypothetical protein PHY59_00665 [Methanobacterium sp.]|nr:hypothetical protein [Methanobacterium sp.]
MNQAVLDLVNSTITYNKAKIGGGIYNYATIYGNGRDMIENNKPNNIEVDPIKPYP